MNYWIIVDDHHDGPYPVDTLVANGLKSEDLVWIEGLTDWTPAGSVPEIAEAIRLRDIALSGAGTPDEPIEEVADATEQPDAVADESTVKPASEVQPEPQTQPTETVDAPAGLASPGFRYAAPAAGQQQPEMIMAAEPCPPAYIAWSIIVTLLCCTIVGIPAIIFASLTKSSYYKGDMAKAKRYSELTQWFIIASIVLGAVSWPFQIAFMSI